MDNYFWIILLIWYITGAAISAGIAVGLHLTDILNNDNLFTYIGAAFLSWFGVGILSIPVIVEAIRTTKWR